MDCISLCCPACFSGFVTITKKTGFLNKATVTAVYDHYSDDGRVYIHGTETSSGSVTSKTTYTSRLELTDPEGNSLGRMDVDLAMSAAYSIGSLFRGNTSPALDKRITSGTAVWGDAKADTASLVP